MVPRRRSQRRSTGTPSSSVCRRSPDGPPEGSSSRSSASLPTRCPTAAAGSPVSASVSTSSACATASWSNTAAAEAPSRSSPRRGRRRRARRASGTGPPARPPRPPPRRRRAPAGATPHEAPSRAARKLQKSSLSGSATNSRPTIWIQRRWRRTSRRSGKARWRRRNWPSTSALKARAASRVGSSGAGAARSRGGGRRPCAMRRAVLRSASRKSVPSMPSRLTIQVSSREASRIENPSSRQTRWAAVSPAARARSARCARRKLRPARRDRPRPGPGSAPARRCRPRETALRRL